MLGDHIEQYVARNFTASTDGLDALRGVLQRYKADEDPPPPPPTRSLLGARLSSTSGTIPLAWPCPTTSRLSRLCRGRSRKSTWLHAVLEASRVGLGLGGRRGRGRACISYRFDLIRPRHVAQLPLDQKRLSDFRRTTVVVVPGFGIQQLGNKKEILSQIRT